MVKKRHLSTKLKSSTKSSTKNSLLLKEFSTTCPCCCKQDLSEPKIIKDVKDFFNENQIQFVLIKDKLTNWRLKAKLAVRKYNGKLMLGLFYKNTHKIAPIKSCIAHHSLITQIALIIEKKAINCSIIPYSEDLSTGDLKYVQIVVNDTKNTAQITFVVNDKALKATIKNFLKAFEKYQFIDSIWVNYNTNKNNVIFSDSWEKISGPAYFWQNFLGKDFAFHPAAFMQSHKQIFEKMVSYIEKNVCKDSAILELYAGVGVIGLSLISKCRKLTLVESNPFSKLSFDETFKKSFSEYEKKVSYQCQDAAFIDDFDDYDVIILDPPRKGLSDKLKNKLAKLENKTIIYVSCNFFSFEKDILKLKENKWSIIDARCFLMFPGSNHVEIIGILKKESG